MPKDKPEKIGERIVVLETKVDAIESDITEIKTDQKKGFSDVGKKLDNLKFGAFAAETKMKSNQEQRSTSLFGVTFPGKKAVVFFILGIGFILFLLMSGYPGLTQFLRGGNSFVECKEDAEGQMECKGDIAKLIEIINGDNHGDNYGGNHVKASNKEEASEPKTAKTKDGVIVFPEETIMQSGEAEVEDEKETGTEDKDKDDGDDGEIE